MTEYALLTGAGASVPFGFPTTVQFFQEKDGEWKFHPPELHDTIIKFLRGSSNNPPDVEDVLGLLDPAAQFFETEAGKMVDHVLRGRITKPFGDLIKQVGTSAEEIKRRCHKLYGKAPNRKLVAKHYEPLFKMMGWKSNPVNWFTTNYDRTAQAMLRVAHEQELGRADGFVLTNEYDPREYEMVPNGIRVYRLHGAIHWFVEDEIFKDQNRGDFVPGRRAFIPPGFKGDPRIGPDGPHKDAHKQLEQELKTVDCLIVIGFSFRDAAINEIIRDAFSENEGLKIVSVNPTTPDHEVAGWQDLREEFKEQIVDIPKEFGTPNLPGEIGAELLGY